MNSDRLQSSGFGELLVSDGWPNGNRNLDCPPWRFPSYLETPIICWDPKIGPFFDVVGGLIFIISDVARKVFDAIDPDAFEYRDCRSVLPDGAPGPKTWLCSVRRGFLGAVDVAASFNVKAPHAPDTFRLFPSVSKVRFKPDVVSDAHILHVADGLGAICCDEIFRNACRGAKLKGPKFGKLF